mgnify:FL=1
MRTGGAGPLAPGPHLPASGVPYAPRTVSPQVLAGWWLVSTDVYADIWTAHPPNMAMCVCESDHGAQGGEGVLFGDLVNYSHPSDNPSACAACTARGGRPSCPSDADASTMAISFAIYCERDWLLGLPPSFDMAGVFFGGLAGGGIADRFGRRRTYLVSLSLFALLYCLSPFAPSFAAYCVLKFGIGLAGSAGNVAAFTLASELVGPRLRTPLTVELWAYLFSVMAVGTAAAAWAMQALSWKVYVLAMALPSVLLLAVSLPLLPRSPHRLQRMEKPRQLRATLLRLLGRRDPQRATVEAWSCDHAAAEGRGGTSSGLQGGRSRWDRAQIEHELQIRSVRDAELRGRGGASSAGTEIERSSQQASSPQPSPSASPPPSPAPGEALDTATSSTASATEGGEELRLRRELQQANQRLATATAAATAGGQSALRRLLAEPRRRRVLLAQMYIWAAVALSYYGLSFNSAKLSDSPHLDFMLSAGTEVFATCACARAMDSPRLGRRASLTAMMLTLSISLGLSTAFMPLARWLSLAGKFAATGAFNLIYIQTAELFPTAVRTTALGLCSAAARIGSIIAPPLGRYAGPRVCMALISGTSAVAALLCWCVVPETLGKGLADEQAGQAEDAGIHAARGSRSSSATTEDESD